MAHRGRRHRLVMYTYILNRWWQPILSIGIVLLVLVAAFTWLPSVLPGYTPLQVTGWSLRLTGGVGVFAIFLAFFLVTIRKSAFVQPYDDHLRLVTPFLRMNISYRRLIQTSCSEMARLFPPDEHKGRKYAFIRPIGGLTANVLELKGLPLPRWALRLFLSPFFFPDRTSRLALLVPDWIKFSTELESFRSTWLNSIQHPGGTPESELLASLAEEQ
jgi:hypothetical protein